jgi:hypothetical protein
MDPKTLDEWIAALDAEDEALSQRQTLVRAARALLAELRADEPVEFQGKLADACRAVLRRDPSRSLSPLQVRDEIKAIGFDTDGYSGNLMAAIHGVLKRLVDSKEAQRKPVKDGSVRYFWIGEPDQPTAPAPASPPVPAKQRPVVDVLAPGVSIGSLRTVMDDINELRKVTEGPAFRRGIIYLGNYILDSLDALR